MGRKTSARGKQSRGRPVEFDREAAVRAAMNRFWKRGFGSVPASDLADSMAITRSSLYNSFGDRESVFREALETYRRLAPGAALGGRPPRGGGRAAGCGPGAPGVSPDQRDRGAGRRPQDAGEGSGGSRSGQRAGIREGTQAARGAGRVLWPARPGRLARTGAPEGGARDRG